VRSVAIIGGGISGLAAAYYLAKAGISSTLIETQSRLGGVIRTELVHGCIVETGPDSFLSAKPWAMDLIRDLGLAGEVIGSNDEKRVTYVRREGRLVPLPDGLMLMVPTRILPMLSTKLLSWPTKIRMGLECFRRPVRAREEDRSVAEFIRDHYGQEAVDYLAEPLLAGVYGGDPERLSVSSVLGRFVELEKKYGSLSRGVLAARKRASQPHEKTSLFQTLREGLGSLVDALSTALNGKTRIIQATAKELERRPDGFRIQTEASSLEADSVILALEAYCAGELVRPLDSELAGLLLSIPYHSSVTIALGFNKGTFDQSLDGFGFLVPKSERRRVVACTWVGTKFDYRVPHDKVVLRCFLGGGDEAVLHESDEELTSTVREELREIMAVRSEPVFSYVARWPRSMAQYTVGHQQRVQAIRARLQQIPGLFLAGNAYDGIGIPDCIHMGKDVARQVAMLPQ
jgi:oxygen-dependent protoporphyrinogen oxidase